MAESIRELVVTLSLQAGNFAKTCTDINNQIKGVQAEFNAVTGGVDSWQTTLEGRNTKLGALTETLTLQKDKVALIAAELEKAKAALAGAPNDANAARKVSSLETQLNNAKAAAGLTKQEIEKLNLISLQNFGKNLETMGTKLKNFGRKFSMYVGGPLAALGIKSFNLAQDYETAMSRLQIATQGSEDTMAGLEEQALQMSTEIPLGFTEIVDLMTKLAQADIPVDQLSAVAKVMAGLGATTDVGMEENAQAIAQFMLVTGASLSDIENMGSTLLVLGNSSVASGAQIFDMAQKMAASGSLAGFSAPNILALAASFASMGIDAEAGGTAAGKLMKAMQLAAETGQGLEDVVQKDGTVVAGFTSVMGVSADEFRAMWGASSTNTMLGFFDALKNGGADGEASVLALLDSMGMTEVRLSNLTAAAAQNPDFFRQMVDAANTAWTENTALAEATAEAYSTSEAQTSTSLNQMENAAADLGENVVDAVQPIITTIGNLAAEFGKLDEATQTRWVAVGAALVALGPLAGTIGTVSSGVGKIITWATKITPAGVTNWKNLLGVLSNPILLGVAAGGALLLAYNYISSLPDELDQIALKATNIPINLDPVAVAEMNRIIDETQASLTELRGGETTEAGAANTQAVTLGYGTQNMFAQAVGYESTVFEGTKQTIITDYAGRIAELEAAIQANPLDTGNAQRIADIATLEAEMSAAVAAAETAYTDKMSGLYNGMVSQLGATQAQLTQAAGTYDLFAAVYDAMNNPAYENDSEEQLAARFAAINARGVELGFTDFSGTTNIQGAYDQMSEEIANGMNTIATDLGTSGAAFNMLQSILNDPTAAQGLDLTKLQGEIEGAIAVLDWKAAAGASGDNKVTGDFGAYLTQGLADGVTANVGTVEGSMYTTRDKTMEALRAAFEMRSPSLVMAREGINVAAGIAQGILQGIPQTVMAMNAMGAALEAAAAIRGAEAGRIYGIRFSNSASYQLNIAIRQIKRELDQLEARVRAGVGGQ